MRGGTNLAAISTDKRGFGCHLEPANFVVIRCVTVAAVTRAANNALMMDGLNYHRVLLGAEWSDQLGLEQILALSERLSFCPLKTNSVFKVAGNTAIGARSKKSKGGLGAKCSYCGAEKSSGCQHDSGCPV